MEKFKIPRKIKKKLKHGFFLYPADENGDSLMGFPAENQEDYTAYKQGILKDRFKKTKAEQNLASIEWRKTYLVPIEMADQELLLATRDAFNEDFAPEAYNVLIKSRTHSIAKESYYTFINAYNLGDINICCMAIDSAERGLKQK